MDRLSSRQEIWLRHAATVGARAAAEAEAAAGLLAPEMSRYCELIEGPSGTPVGFMVRGEDRGFTERAQDLLRSWRMPEEALGHHAALAHLFEHQRAFLKLEWAPPADPAGDEPEHLAAFYYRRRPSVDEVIEQLGARGVREEVLGKVGLLARVLARDHVHFVAGSMRRGEPLRHKLYFAQLADMESGIAVAARLRTALGAFELDGDARAQLAMYHDALAPSHRGGTIFVSMSFTDTELVPSLKIDYPEVSPRVGAALLPIAEQAAAEAEMRRFAALVGKRTLSYLGVRINARGPIALKYYADFAEEAPGDG